MSESTSKHRLNELEISDKERADRAFLANVLRRTHMAGLHMMHRRNGQYWLMRAEPMTVREIDRFLFANNL